MVSDKIAEIVVEVGVKPVASIVLQQHGRLALLHLSDYDRMEVERRVVVGEDVVKNNLVTYRHYLECFCMSTQGTPCQATLYWVVVNTSVSEEPRFLYQHGFLVGIGRHKTARG